MSATNTGYWPQAVYKIPDAIYCMIRAIEWLYQDVDRIEPISYRHLPLEERNAEIARRYAAGDSSEDLALEFGISDRRIRYIIKPETRK